MCCLLFALLLFTFLLPTPPVSSPYYNAVLRPSLRSPLTGAVFALELTHDINSLPALLIASVTAYGFTVLVMKRSILTEKVARRGYHVSREYSVDPLELVTAQDVMTAPVVTVPASLSVSKLLNRYFLGEGVRKHQGYPVVDTGGLLLGVVTRSDVLKVTAPDETTAGELVHLAPVTAHPSESCRSVAERMAETGVGRVVVVADDSPRKVVGIVTRSDLLKPRGQTVEQESKREKFIRLRTKKVRTTYAALLRSAAILAALDSSLHSWAPYRRERAQQKSKAATIPALQKTKAAFFLESI